MKLCWGGNGDFLDMQEIQVDRNYNKGFVVFVFDTTPNYTDSTPFPAVSAKWTYKAIYRVNDAQVGLWTAPVSVNVSGKTAPNPCPSKGRRENVPFRARFSFSSGTAHRLARGRTQHTTKAVAHHT